MPLRRWHVRIGDWKSPSDHQRREFQRSAQPFHAQDTSWYSSSWLSKISSFRQETSHLYYRNDPVKYNLDSDRQQLTSKWSNNFSHAHSNYVAVDKSTFFRPKAVLLLCLGHPNQETYTYSMALCFIPRYDATWDNQSHLGTFQSLRCWLTYSIV